MTTFFNFAYGSNMSTRRLRARTPSARPVAIGRVDGHRLAWHMSGQDGSGKCDLHQTGQGHDAVWGVVYEISLSERTVLDRFETLGTGYRFKTVAVQTATGVVEAGAYYAIDIGTGLRPYDWYHAYVLTGALEHGLPEDYLGALSTVAVMTDPDAARRAHNLAQLQAKGLEPLGNKGL